MDGQPSSQLTIEVAKENGIDLSHHRSKSITSWDLRNSSLILTMTPGHREELLNYFSADSDRLYTLKGFLRKNKISNESIDDPYGLNLNFYRRIFNEIENEIDRIYPELKRRI
jgi:protein-tyrosine-phosphatase